MLKCETCGKELDAAAVPVELTHQISRVRRPSMDAQHQRIRVIYYFCSPECKEAFLASGESRRWCAVCDKIIQEPQEELTYKTRIDRRLPGETSHFKHIHVTYYFCSPECKEKFFAPREEDLFLSEE